MLKARGEKVSRNASDPQVDVQVVYSDEDMKPPFQTTRIFTFPVDEELTIEKVEAAIKQAGKELEDGLKNTIQKEVDIREAFQGKEIKI